MTEEVQYIYKDKIIKQEDSLVTFSEIQLKKIKTSTNIYFITSIDTNFNKGNILQKVDLVSLDEEYVREWYINELVNKIMEELGE